MSRFQAWTLRSRIRYALVWGAIHAASLCVIALLVRYPEIYVERALPYATIGFPLSVLVQGLIGYPVAMRRHPTRHV